jgi:autotransporter-associated beta strand protein
VVTGDIVNGASNATVGITKSGSGRWALAGNNTYTGATTVNGGTLAISAPVGSATVSFTGNASLAYSGASDATFSNAVAVSSEVTGTIANEGGSTLTLAGNIDKSGSVLNLSGGAFNVTGAITGTTTNFNSDLVVSNASVNLAAAASYFGPTAIVGGSRLTAGVNDALPVSTVVTLGGASDLASQVNSIDLNGHAQTLAGLRASGDAAAQVVNTGANTASLTLNGASVAGVSIGEKIDVAVNGGSLLLSNQNQLAVGNNVALNNSTLSVGDGVNVTVGSLTLTGASVIDFSGLGGRTTISFNSLTIADTLSVYNWVEGVTVLNDLSSGA